MKELIINNNFIENNNMVTNMVGGGVISEGGYGCVFYPKLMCSGKSTSNTKYISKIQKENFFSDNEVYISSLIKEIPNFENFFNVVLSSCKVSLSKISKNEISKCKNTLEGVKSAVLFNLKYINNKNLYSILTNKKLLIYHLTDDNTYSAKHNIYIIINTFKMILASLNKLINHKIIHFDLKPDNILYDTDRNIPIIIDFGISINKDKLEPATYKKHFYVFFPEYYIWCLEIHYICYLLHVNNSPNEDDINEICNDYVNNNPVLKMFSANFIQKYKDLCVKSLLQWIGKDHLKVIEKLLQFSDTWDLYSVSIIYLTIIYHWGVRGFNNNKFMIELSKLLLQNIHPFSNQRYSIDDTINAFDRLFYNNANEKNIYGVISIVNENFEHIKDSVIGGMTKLNMLKKSITV